MRNVLWIVGLVSLVACGKKEGAGASGSAAPESSSKAKAKASPCSPKAWKEPSGLFCVETAGYAPGELKKNTNVSADDPDMEIWFKKEAEGGSPESMFKVSWSPKHDADEALGVAGSMESDYKNNKGEDKGDFAGTLGKYVVFARKDNEQSHQLYAVVKGKQHAYRCEASTFGRPIPPEVVTACKSLVPTD